MKVTFSKDNTPGRGADQRQRRRERVGPTVKVNRLLLGNTGVLGAASREYFEQHPAAVPELWARLTELQRTGVLGEPPVQLYPFDDARGALRAIADRRAQGTVVLSRQARAVK